jgi:hypothetical protein
VRRADHDVHPRIDAPDGAPDADRLGGLVHRARKNDQQVNVGVRGLVAARIRPEKNDLPRTELLADHVADPENARLRHRQNVGLGQHGLRTRFCHPVNSRNAGSIAEGLR